MVKAKIAFLHGPHDLRIEEVNVPDPKPDQILIKLKAAGICGSDVECFEGHSAEGRYDIAPYTPGHEWAGQVAAIGNQVTGFKVGDKVTGDCCMNCFKCENCKRGLMPAACLNFREAGFRPDSPGGWGEYLLMEEHYVHKLPADWRYEEGALVEPFSVGHYGVWGPGGWVDASDDVVIFGGGMIGLCALLTCKAASANVMVVEPLANRRDLAKTLGADVVIDPTQVKDLAAEVGKHAASWPGRERRGGGLGQRPGHRGHLRRGRFPAPPAPHRPLHRPQGPHRDRQDPVARHRHVRAGWDLLPHAAHHHLHGSRAEERGSPQAHLAHVPLREAP